MFKNTSRIKLKVNKDKLTPLEIQRVVPQSPQKKLFYKDLAQNLNKYGDNTLGVIDEFGPAVSDEREEDRELVK